MRIDWNLILIWNLIGIVEIANGKNSALTASQITHAGKTTAGNNLNIQADTVNNLGTGRIYGDHVAIQASNLTNAEETLNNQTKTAVIAARNRLDLGVGNFTNQEHAQILSLGDMAIGGQLDANHHVQTNTLFTRQ
jgi:filamentous hemagglutinin